MNARILIGTAAALVLGAANPPRTAPVSQQHQIDTRQSVMTIRVYKAGAFSAFGHNHEITAPIASGTVDTAARKTELHVHAAALRVSDHDASEKDRGEIQSTMVGPPVLDTHRYPETVFRSTGIEPAGSGAWTVHGSLTLHGQTRPVTVAVSERDGHYVGSSLLRQTDFGITPVKVAGGSIKVKDEIRIEFDIRLAR
jgi:polyisoprenoid-binding protein YceI